MRTRLLSLALILSLALPGCRPQACADPLGCLLIPPGEPVRVGLLLPMSGPDAETGLEQRRALEQAFAELGALRGHPVELIAADSDCGGAGDSRAATEFALQAGLAAVIGAPCPGGPGARILSDAGLGLVPVSTPDPALSARSVWQAVRDTASRDPGGRLTVPRATLRAALEGE